MRTYNDEQWKPVVYKNVVQGKYEVSNYGNVRNAKTKKLMKIHTKDNLYKHILLYTDEGKQITCLIHRLVATAFVPGRTETRDIINHIDGNPANNHESNLEWCTQKENMQHAFLTGLERPMIGEENPACKMSEKDIRTLCEIIRATRGDIPTIKSRLKELDLDIPEHIIKDVKCKNTWRHVSDNYFNKYDIHKVRLLSNEEIGMIRNSLERNDNKPYLVLNELKDQIPELTYKKIEHIKYGRSHKNNPGGDYMADLKRIKDDKITIITNDIQRIRTRPSMIIGFLGERGILHLCKEIIDNNRDECMKPESPGNTITIEITDDYIISSDNGRGLPTNLLRTIHETSQAGSNMTRTHGSTAGENGIGTTAFTALSSELIVTTFRPQEKKKYTVKYKEGKLVDEILEEYKGEEHGLRTFFKPSKKILGESKIPVDQLVEWIKDFEYTLPETTKMIYTVNGDRNVIVHKKIYQYFDDIIMPEKFMSSPIEITCSGNLQEVIQETVYDRKFKVDAAILYSTPDYHGEDIRKSWMNMIYTSQNGSHMNGVVNGVMKYLNERVKIRKKSLEDEDLRKDILSNLHVVVRAECDFANMFSSQAKSTVFPRQLTTAITEAVYKELCDMNQTKLNDLVEIVIQNNRVRKEGERVRNIASETKKKQWSTPDSYLPCASIKTPQPKEIFLCEGKSARGGISSARNAKFQAILMFQGKAPNVWDMTLDQALKSTVWFDMVKLLGCGIGSNFDIKKLNFDKIIIATDADVDGYHIRVSICAFFLRFMPELLEVGKVYIAEPPLYKLMRGKNISYVASQTEYIQECIRSVGNIQLEFPEVKD